MKARGRHAVGDVLCLYAHVCLRLCLCARSETKKKVAGERGVGLRNERFLKGKRGIEKEEEADLAWRVLGTF